MISCATQRTTPPSGMLSVGSISSDRLAAHTTPRPVQVGHAPSILLNEK